MKKITLLLVFIVISICLTSQTPQAFKYQAVVRNDLGEVINNQTVSFRISIHDDTPAGTLVFQETHVIMTDAYGHANLEIGKGTPVTGTISGIDWGTNDKFLEVELDPTGSSVYVSMGTTQLLAVPYALYAETTGIGESNTLDQAYDQGGPGAGRTITADNGAVNIDGNDGLTINGNVGIGTTANIYPLSVYPGTNLRGININHNQTGIGDTYGLYLDLARTASGDNQAVGMFANTTNENGNAWTYGIYGSASGNATGSKFGVYGIAYGSGSNYAIYGANTSGGAEIQFGISGNSAGNGSGIHYGLYGNAYGTGTQYGVFGNSNGTGTAAQYGVRGEATGSGTGVHYGVYGTATGGGILWAGYFAGRVYVSGNVGIGTQYPTAFLHTSVNNFGRHLKCERTGASPAYYEIYLAGNKIYHNSDVDQIINVDSVDILYIKENGNVAIGADVATEKLQVAGTVYSTVGGFRFPDGTVQSTAATAGGSIIYINDLTDAKTGGLSVFLGEGAGVNDDGTDNVNTALGYYALNYNISGTGNTAIGNSALLINTTGGGNTATGYAALAYNTTAAANTANGYFALFNNSTGHDNTAIGYEALYANYTGSYNTATGWSALRNNGIGSYNTANGYCALVSNQAGEGNTASGLLALYANSNGSSNTAAGSYALYNNNGNYNVGLGSYANYNNVAGSQNTIIGFEAGRGTGNHSKSGNVFLGYRAGYNEIGNDKLYIENSDSDEPLIWGDFSTDSLIINGNLNVTGDIYLGDKGFTIDYLTDGKTGQYSVYLGEGAGETSNGSNNTVVGYRALYSNTSGYGNVVLGDFADFNNTGSYYNTIVGANAGHGTSTHFKSGNIFLGFQAGYYETGNNKLYIENSFSDSPLIWGDFVNDRVVINGNETHNTNDRTFFSNGSAGGTTAWYNDSDVRLKKNIETISNALEKVQKLRGVNFEWENTENRSVGNQIGFVAQEANEVIPEVVDNGGEYMSMQYAPITALLVEAIKEQQELIETQQSQIDELKQMISEMSR